MNELDCLAQLSELVETIQKNNWEHLYDKCGIIELEEKQSELKKKINELQKQNSDQRIAIKAALLTLNKV